MSMVYMFWKIHQNTKGLIYISEMMTQCEQEGGECINVNIFRGTVGRSGGAEDRGAPRGRQGVGRPGPARRQDPQAIFNYLYNECRSWEFDPGCYRKGNVCCY